MVNKHEDTWACKGESRLCMSVPGLDMHLYALRLAQYRVEAEYCMAWTDHWNVPALAKASHAAKAAQWFFGGFY
jgi:hypothetical protein